MGPISGNRSDVGTLRDAAGMRVVTYLRVSREDQVRSGLGVEAQREQLAAAAVRRDWLLVAEQLDLGVSGRLSWLQRPSLVAAVRMVEVGEADALAVARLDRLSRKTQDALHLVDELGAGLVCLSPDIDTTTAAGVAFFSIMATFATFESALISERTTAALQAKMARGERIGRPRSCPDATLDRVLELRTLGLSLLAIAEAMNAAGVLTPAGSSRWWPSHVSRLLRTQDARVRVLPSAEPASG